MTRCWALLSGGKDSVCTASVLAERGELNGCVFMDTGIACPDTRPFVERLCEEKGWPLRVFSAPKSYEMLVERYGFPKGPTGHRWAYGALKERALRQAARELGAEGPLTFASGVRVSESSRRSKSVRLEAGRYGDRGFDIVAPIADWTTERVWKYLREHGLSVSPAYVSIGISGDCLCGAFSSQGEAEAILKTYPEVAARIRELEGKMAGRIPFPKDRWGSDRTRGGFRALSGRTTLESYVCGGDCAREAAL